MGTYELYLWEPEVDLSNQEWNTAIASHDEDATTSITREKIYYLHKDKEHSAPHIEKFFNCILEILNKPEYQAYFEGLSDWIIEQQGDFNKSPRLVFQDEDTLANATSHEFKRALYEAIEQSGVCAYETMNGYLLPSDSIARKSIFKEIFNAYPVLVPQVPRPPVTLDAIPQNITEMKDMLIAFMQQHPVGKKYEVETIVKEFDDKKQYYGLSFKMESGNIIHKFKIMLEYIKRDKFFSLELINNSFYIEDEYLTKVEKEMLENNALFFNEIKIESYLFYIPIPVGSLSFFSSLNKENKSLGKFNFELKDSDFFDIFLKQLGDFLNIFSLIYKVKDLENIFLNSKYIFDEEVKNNILKGIFHDGTYNHLIASFLKICALSTTLDIYVDSIESVLINSQSVSRRESIKKNTNEIIKMANIVKEYMISKNDVMS